MSKNWREFFGMPTVEEEVEEQELLEEPAKEEIQKPLEITLPGNSEGHGQFDPSSKTWLHVKQWAKDKLDKLRKNNDIISTDEKQTAANSGRIDMLKKILKIPTENMNVR